MISQQKFPKNFLWGASTASHQVEGGTVNQWSQWELEHAAKLAATAEQRLSKSTHVVKSSDWKDIKPLATDPDNYVSGAGVEHYERYEEDFDLLEKLNLNAFRFGIEWSRLQPKEGAWNGEAIRHYHDYIDSLNQRGITPVLNIWHWTMPTWFTDKGGFEKKDNLAFFDTYVAKIAEEYGDKLKYVITLNEPNVYSSFGYLTGEWPPQQKKPLLMLKVYRNLAQAHKRAYRLLKNANPALQVGVAAQLANIQAKRPHNLLDGSMTKVMRYAWNWWFLNRIKRCQDFVGINYYFTDYYKGLNGKDTPHVPVNDLDWYMEPEGLYPLLLRTWVRYKKPIIITENGVADREDHYRQWWIEETIVAMQRAMSEGVDLRGYLHWSLLDNFEWAYGWWPKFGLVAVDRDNDMKRTPRPSALWFAEQLAELQSKPKADKRPAKPRRNDDSTPNAKTRHQPVAKPSASSPKNGNSHRLSPPAHVPPHPMQPQPPDRGHARKQVSNSSMGAVTDIGMRLRVPPRRVLPPPLPQPPVTKISDDMTTGRLDMSRLRKRVQ